MKQMKSVCLPLLLLLALNAHAETGALPHLQLLPGHRVYLHGEWPEMQEARLLQALKNVSPRLETRPQDREACFDEIAFSSAGTFGVDDRSKLHRGYAFSYVKLAFSIARESEIEAIETFLLANLPPLKVKPQTSSLIGRCRTALSQFRR